MIVKPRPAGLFAQQNGTSGIANNRAERERVALRARCPGMLANPTAKREWAPQHTRQMGMAQVEAGMRGQMQPSALGSA